MEGRPNRHSNQSKYAVKNRKGRKFIFFKKKNREVREIMKAMA